MSNYSIKIDCLRLKGAFLRNIKGKTSTKRCLMILVDDCDGMFVGEKGCYLNLTALEMKEPKFGDTHCVKPNLTREQREAMTEEEARNVPILGGMHALERRQQQQAQQPTSAAQEVSRSDNNLDFDAEDLPF